jgi:hypothetical protein
MEGSQHAEYLVFLASSSLEALLSVIQYFALTRKITL